MKLLDCFIQHALASMKEKNLIKSHSLPQISITDELKSHNVLSFPGKVTSFSSAEGNLLAIGDTGHNRIIVTDDRGTIKVRNSYYNILYSSAANNSRSLSNLHYVIFFIRST